MYSTAELDCHKCEVSSKWYKCFFENGKLSFNKVSVDVGLQYLRRSNLFSARTPSKPHATPLWRGGGGLGNVFSIWTKNKEFVILSTNITTKDSKGPQTNMPKNVGSIKT